MKSYQTMSSDEILSSFETSISGLSTEEVEARIQKYGLNELPKKKKDGIVKIFFSQFANSITVIMIIACILSLFIKEYTDAIAITFIIVVDAIVGTIQECKANKSAEALSNMIKARTQVIRNGKEMEVDASNLVVGDIMLLQSGDKVAADGRIINCSNLTINESILTGDFGKRILHNFITISNKWNNKE